LLKEVNYEIFNIDNIPTPINFTVPKIYTINSIQDK